MAKEQDTQRASDGADKHNAHSQCEACKAGGRHQVRLFVCCLAAAVGLAARREGLDELGRCGKAMTGGVNEEDASALEGADCVI